MYQEDTIAAVATPAGNAGIGIVKISGLEALKIVSRFFRSSTFNPESVNTHRLYYGTVYDPEDGCKLDEVLVAYMKGPTSYTGEDVVEINCHGGMVVLQKILDISLKEGTRLAEPGEFTKRAFLNSRIDLTQAEAVCDVIESKTDTALKLSVRQLKGDLGEKIHGIKNHLLDIISSVEASIDFPEDELDHDAQEEMSLALSGTSKDLHNLISTYKQGCLYRTGIHTVIVGKPNVGKSSILNTLLGKNRAIVTSIPGTTRDVIQETINLNGIPVKLSDTAGLHESVCEIEKMGMDRTNSEIEDADLVLFIVDGSLELTDHDRSIARILQSKKTITVINKSDLPHRVSEAMVQKLLPTSYVFQVSALYHQGINELKNGMLQIIVQEQNSTASDLLISNARHKSALEKAYRSLELAYKGFHQKQSPELIAVDLQASLHALGEVTGETTTEDILDRIFSKFCIGK